MAAASNNTRKRKAANIENTYPFYELLDKIASGIPMNDRQSIAKKLYDMFITNTFPNEQYALFLLKTMAYVIIHRNNNTLLDNFLHFGMAMDENHCTGIINLVKSNASTLIVTGLGSTYHTSLFTDTLRDFINNIMENAGMPGEINRISNSTITILIQQIKSNQHIDSLISPILSECQNLVRLCAYLPHCRIKERYTESASPSDMRHMKRYFHPGMNGGKRRTRKRATRKRILRKRPCRSKNN